MNIDMWAGPSVSHPAAVVTVRWTGPGSPTYPCALGNALRERGLRPEVEAVIDEHLDDLEAATSTKRACALLGAVAGDPATGAVTRPSRGRRRRGRQPPNKLTEAERQHVLSVLRSPEYCDLAPAQVWARLLDDGVYLCSISTMYRLLAIAGENRERRRQRTHPANQKPELIARRPEPGVVVGHHQAARPATRYLLRAVRDHRHLLPLRRRLDGRRRPKPASWPRRSSPTPSPATASPATSSPCTPTAAPR